MDHKQGSREWVDNNKKTVAPAKSSPLKKGEKSIKSSSPKQQGAPVHESDAYFIVKHIRGKVSRVPPSQVFMSSTYLGKGSDVILGPHHKAI